MSKENTPKKKMSRRRFIALSTLGGTGLLVGATYLGRNALRRGIFEAMEAEPNAMFMGSTDMPLIWFEISADNTVTLYSPKVEMGQGTFTGLAQIAADELDVSFDQMKVEHAPTETGNIDGLSTGGSNSISGLWTPLRELAATMREMIKTEAAKKLNVSADSLSTSNGVITSGSKTMTYAEVVNGVTQWEVPETPMLKPIKEYQFVGKPLARVDLKAKVFGEPIFGMDATLPDMLYGDVVRPSLIGATFIGADTAEAEKMPGVVKVVVEEDFVGVVATSRMAAHKAKKAIKAEWKVDKNWQTEDIEEMIKVGKGTAHVIQKAGDAESILSGNDIIESEFSSPIGAHAQLEPNGALAFVESDKATIKMSTQVINVTRSEVAKRLGFEEDKVNVIPTYLGGGFGRRLHTPNAVQAAVLSKAVGKPVKCFFDRKEEFQNDTFRPPTHHVLKAKLNDNGTIEAIEHNVSSGDVAFNSAIFPSFANNILGSDVGAWRGGMFQYKAIPNLRALSWRVELPFATSFWRSLGLLANTFAIESFMDELAVKAGKDPVEFRLNHIQDNKQGNRLRKVIETAAESGNWKDGVSNGRAMGFAASTDGATPAAHVVEVSIENNEIKVHKVTCVMDPGIIINPDQVKAQCEGSIIMGMSAAMHERMYVKDGQLRPTIYGPYDMARMKHSPKEIDVILLQNDSVPGSVGEPPMGPIGAAIANAVFRITGERLRSMPLQLS